MKHRIMAGVVVAFVLAGVAVQAETITWDKAYNSYVALNVIKPYTTGYSLIDCDQKGLYNMSSIKLANYNSGSVEAVTFTPPESAGSPPVVSFQSRGWFNIPLPGPVLSLKNTSTVTGHRLLDLQVGPANPPSNEYPLEWYSSTATNYGGVYFTSSSTGIYQPSDASLKDNIRDSSLNGLSVVKKVRVRDYEMKAGGAAGRGIVAQELEAAFPDAILAKPLQSDWNDAPKKCIKQDALILVLWDALQEEIEAREALEARLAEFEKR